GKVISRVECAVAYEFIYVAMESVGARLGDGVNDSSGSFTVLRRKASRQDRKLLNGVHTQGGADHVARPAVSVVIDADTIQPVIVVCRPLAGNGELRTEAAVSAGRGGIVHLG